MAGQTRNDPFEGAFFGQVTIGDGFLHWKGISRLTWDYNNFDVTVAGRFFDGFREQRANHVNSRESDFTVPVEQGGVIEHWIFTDLLHGWSGVLHFGVHSASGTAASGGLLQG